MTSKSRIAAFGLTVSLALTALAGWGCGETGDTDPTPVQTFKITPAANATSAPASTATNEPTAPPPGGTVDGSAIAIAGVSSVFDVEEIEAHAGTITVAFDNRDGGVIHNIHFFRGSDNEGESVAETELEAGPIKQTLTFEVEPGEYFYQCDVHPTTMEGTLTVE